MRGRSLLKGQAIPEFQSRFVLPAGVVEEEFKAAGFQKISRLEYLPFCGLGRIYVPAGVASPRYAA